MLVGISIKNYAVLQELHLGLTLNELEKATSLEQAENLVALSQFTVLIGQNSTGKTTFFEALDFLSNMLIRDVQVAANKTKQASYHKLICAETLDGKSIEFNLLFKKYHLQENPIWLSYHVIIDADKNFRPFIRKEIVEKLSFSSESGLLVKETILEIEQGQGKVQKIFLLGDHQENSEVFEPIQLTESKISALSILGKMIQYTDIVWLNQQLTKYYLAQFAVLPEISQVKMQTGGHKHLNRKATNIENVLKYMKEQQPKRYNSLFKRLNQNLPANNKFDLEKSSPINGAGNLKLLIMYLVLADQRPIIALDEPDAGLYYEMIDALLVELRDYSVRNPESQIFISTHSANVLDAFAPGEVWSFDRISKDDDHPQIMAKYIGDNKIVKAMYAEGIGLGSLWYSGYMDAD